MLSFEFSDWLDSDEFTTIVDDYRSSGQEPTCLLDIITLWVMRTDALLRFPTFSSFLLTVLEITNEWQRDPQVYASSFLWPLPPGSDEDGLIITSLAGPWEGRRYNRNVTSHDIMREENFLLRQAELRYERDSIHP
ncbi:hypothetical protein [Microbacterium sp. S1037]|uniref:hypothetical protein n=1 Tax=Microbacterium sp. S1037 TaxID=3398227 RepID=UPI003AB0234B